ncbi:hypothetical protein Pelo_12052 [Pelomyxa schiedti]|nr:hypothetical protein Pelo_12052 [Pelomyxa schiedti]
MCVLSRLKNSCGSMLRDSDSALISESSAKLGLGGGAVGAGGKRDDATEDLFVDPVGDEDEEEVADVVAVVDSECASLSSLILARFEYQTPTATAQQAHTTNGDGGGDHSTPPSGEEEAGGVEGEGPAGTGMDPMALYRRVVSLHDVVEEIVDGLACDPALVAAVFTKEQLLSIAAQFVSQLLNVRTCNSSQLAVSITEHFKMANSAVEAEAPGAKRRRILPFRYRKADGTFDWKRAMKVALKAGSMPTVTRLLHDHVPPRLSVREDFATLLVDAIAIVCKSHWEDFASILHCVLSQERDAKLMGYFLDFLYEITRNSQERDFRHSIGDSLLYELKKQRPKVFIRVVAPQYLVCHPPMELFAILSKIPAMKLSPRIPIDTKAALWICIYSPGVEERHRRDFLPLVKALCPQVDIQTVAKVLCRSTLKYGTLSSVMKSLAIELLHYEGDLRNILCNCAILHEVVDEQTLTWLLDHGAPCNYSSLKYRTTAIFHHRNNLNICRALLLQGAFCKNEPQDSILFSLDPCNENFCEIMEAFTVLGHLDPGVHNRNSKSVPQVLIDRAHNRSLALRNVYVSFALMWRDDLVEFITRLSRRACTHSISIEAKHRISRMCVQRCAALLSGTTARAGRHSPIQTISLDVVRTICQFALTTSWFSLISSENEKTAQSAHLQSSFFGSLLGRKPVRSHSSSSGSEGLFSGWFDSKPSKLDGKEEMDTSSSTHSKAGRVDHKTKHRNTQVKSKVDLGDHNPKADKAESSTPSAPQGGEANFFSNIVTPLPKLLERFFGPKASDMFIASSESSSISSEDESDQSSSPSSPRKQENKQVSPPAVAEQDEVVVKIGGGGTHLIELTEESSSSGPHKGEQRLGYRIVKKRAKKVPTDTTSTSSTVCIINKTEISQHS